jgi:hypothetical protein
LRRARADVSRVMGARAHCDGRAERRRRRWRWRELRLSICEIGHHRDGWEAAGGRFGRTLKQATLKSSNRCHLGESDSAQASARHTLAHARSLARHGAARRSRPAPRLLLAAPLPLFVVCVCRRPAGTQVMLARPGRRQTRAKFKFGRQQLCVHNEISSDNRRAGRRASERRTTSQADGRPPAGLAERAASGGGGPSCYVVVGVAVVVVVVTNYARKQPAGRLGWPPPCPLTSTTVQWVAGV